MPAPRANAAIGFITATVTLDILAMSLVVPVPPRPFLIAASLLAIALCSTVTARDRTQ